MKLKLLGGKKGGEMWHPNIALNSQTPSVWAASWLELSLKSHSPIFHSYHSMLHLLPLGI